MMMVFVFSASCSVHAASTDLEKPVVESQNIVVTLMPSDHLLVGESTIRYAAGIRGISLRLSPSARIESVFLSGVEASFSFTGGLLSLGIPVTGKPETISVKVAYSVIFNDPLPLNPGSSEDPTYGVSGTITKQGTFLIDGAGWYPVPSTIPQKRTIWVSAPAGTEAVTAGRRVSRETKDSVSYSYWEEMHPVGGLSLSAGPYKIEERRVNGVDLYTYFYPENTPLAPRYLDAAAKYLSVYGELFGAYPFEKFAVVENFFPTGYGFPSFTLLGSAIIRLPFIIDTSFPHEIAHSWWGNAIQVDQSEGNWSEGLVTYLADYLLKEKRSVAEGREYRMQFLTDYAALVAPEHDFPLSAFTSRVDPASRAIGYGKGAMVFNMIRNEIGDRAFFDALRVICKERIYRSATWNDFEHAFSLSSGRNLTTFMKQWLSRAGGPHLTLSQVTRRREGEGWMVSGTVVQTPPFFELSLPLQLETNGASTREIVPVSQALTPFTFSSSAEPRHLSLDPDAEVFRVLSSSEIPVTVNSIKGSKKILAVMTADCRAREETFRRLLESLGKGSTGVIREEELDKERIRTHDLIFCGTPKQRTLLPPIPTGISFRNTEISVNEHAAYAPDGLIFLVLQYPDSSGRIAALFQPLSELAAEQYTSKITHYGKYGSLMFTGGAIRYKSTIPPSAGGSVVGF
jgi:hypothetical protein